MKCDIIIPIWNQLDITKDCIDSIIRNTRYPYRLILIDNASDEETRRYLEDLKSKASVEILLVRNEINLGFVKAVNQGLKLSDAPYVCVFNNDTVTTPGWLGEMVKFAEAHKEVGIINPLCGVPDGINSDEYAKLIAVDNKGKCMEMNQCFLFCALIKREVIDRVGILDEVFGVGCYDDTDYSMRAGLAGYRCICLHSAVVRHLHGVSFKARGGRDKIVAKGEKEYFKKWPRHLRAAIVFSISDNTSEEKIANMLKSVLYLARQWCWINLLVFCADLEKAEARIKTVSERIGMPVHQNIKFNILSEKNKFFHILVRLIERSFGTKARKKYDFLITDSNGPVKLANAFKFIHNVNAEAVDFTLDQTGVLAGVIDNIRNKR